MVDDVGTMEGGLGDRKDIQMCLDLTNAALSVAALDEKDIRVVMALLDTTLGKYPNSIAVGVLHAEALAHWFDGTLLEAFEELLKIKELLNELETIENEDFEYISRMMFLLGQWSLAKICALTEGCGDISLLEKDLMANGTDGTEHSELKFEINRLKENIMQGKEMSQQLEVEDSIKAESFGRLCLTLSDFYMSPPGCFILNAEELARLEIVSALEATSSKSFPALVSKAKYALAVDHQEECADACTYAVRRLDELIEDENEESIVPLREEITCLLKIMIELDLEVSTNQEQRAELEQMMLGIAQMMHDDGQGNDLEASLLLFLTSVKTEDAEICKRIYNELEDLGDELPEAMRDTINEHQSTVERLVAQAE